VHSGEYYFASLYMGTNNKQQMAGWFRGSFFHRNGDIHPCPPLRTPLSHIQTMNEMQKLVFTGGSRAMGRLHLQLCSCASA